MARGKMKRKTNIKSYLRSSDCCPNLYEVTYASGPLGIGDETVCYCSAACRELDRGYANNVCKRLLSKSNPQSCNAYKGRTYPFR